MGAAPWRLSRPSGTPWAAGLWLGTLAAAVAVLPFLFTRLPVEARAAEDTAETRTELREQLLGLGFPAEILDGLTDGETARFQGAYGVTVKGVRYESGNCPDGIPHMAIVEAPVRDDHYGWRVEYLACLTWDEGMTYRTEGIRLRPNCQGVVLRVDGPEGVLRWREDGERYAAPLAFRPVGDGTAYPNYLCSFSLPAEGREVTGYVFWSAVSTWPEIRTSYNYELVLAHRRTPWEWPYALPSDVLMDGGSRVGWQMLHQLYTGQLAPAGKYASMGDD